MGECRHRVVPARIFPQKTDRAGESRLDVSLQPFGLSVGRLREGNFDRCPGVEPEPSASRVIETYSSSRSRRRRSRTKVAGGTSPITSFRSSSKLAPPVLYPRSLQRVSRFTGTVVGALAINARDGSNRPPVRSSRSFASTLALPRPKPARARSAWPPTEPFLGRCPLALLAAVLVEPRPRTGETLVASGQIRRVSSYRPFELVKAVVPAREELDVDVGGAAAEFFQLLVDDVDERPSPRL